MIRPALVAPDTFKGTFGAAEVAAAVARGLRDAGIEAVELPVADGGEGTLEALLDALGGELLSARRSRIRSGATSMRSSR
jgi:glycerate kinase